MRVTTRDGSVFDLVSAYAFNAPSNISPQGWYMTADSDERGYTWISGQDIVRIEYVPGKIVANSSA